jgi:hypothetical protein
MAVIQYQHDNLLATREQFQGKGEVIAEAWETITSRDGNTHVVGMRVVTKTTRKYYRCVRYWVMGNGDYEKWYASIDHDQASPDEAIHWTADAAFVNTHNQQPQCVATKEAD